MKCYQDVGKSILESYSRVLESLAFNIVARIDDLLYVDNLTKHSDAVSPMTKVGLIAHKSVSLPYTMTVASTPYKTAFTTPSFSPAQHVSAAKGDMSPFNTKTMPQRGVGVKKVLTDYLNIDGKDSCILTDRPGTPLNSINGKSPSRTSIESISSPKQDLGVKK